MDVPSGRAEVPRLWFLGLGRFCAHPISQRLLRDSVAWLAQKEAIRQQPPVTPKEVLQDFLAE